MMTKKTEKLRVKMDILVICMQKKNPEFNFLVFAYYNQCFGSYKCLSWEKCFRQVFIYFYGKGEGDISVQQCQAPTTVVTV